MNSFLFDLLEPSLLQFVDVESTTKNITATWSWPEELESNITGFIVQYRLASSMDEFSNSTTISPDQRTGVLPGLEPGQSYEIRVIAISREQPDVPVAVSPERTVNTISGELNLLTSIMCVIVLGIEN